MTATQTAPTAAAAPTPTGTKFESETCSRCGGSGTYSYCTMYGDRCFRCQGARSTYTTRGAVAKRFFEDSLCVLASDVAMGTLLNTNEYTRGKKRFGRVVKIDVRTEPNGRSWIQATGEWVPSGIGNLIFLCEYRDGTADTVETAPGETVRAGWSDSEKAEKLAAALAYQATLTKAGKPRVRPAPAPRGWDHV